VEAYFAAQKRILQQFTSAIGDNAEGSQPIRQLLRPKLRLICSTLFLLYL
jgi:hypothetical protein